MPTKDFETRRWYLWTAAKEQLGITGQTICFARK